MASISGWVETAIFSLLFLSVMGLVVSSFNLEYGKNYDIGLRDEKNTDQLFITYMDTSKEKIEGGEVQFNAISGITLKSSWDVMKDAFRILWGFITGNFIVDIIGAWNLGAVGDVLAISLRVVYFLSLVWLVIYAMFKVII